MSDYFSPRDGHKFMELLAYELWRQRGCPIGSPEVDWSAAERVVLAWLTGFGGGLPYALSAWNQTKVCIESRIED
jgi:hypothetical protein